MNLFIFLLATVIKIQTYRVLKLWTIIQYFPSLKKILFDNITVPFLLHLKCEHKIRMVVSGRRGFIRCIKSTLAGFWVITLIYILFFLNISRGSFNCTLRTQVRDGVYIYYIQYCKSSKNSSSDDIGMSGMESLSSAKRIALTPTLTHIHPPTYTHTHSRARTEYTYI